MKQSILIFWILLFTILLCSCASYHEEALTDNAEESGTAQIGYDNGNHFSTATEVPQPDWEPLGSEVFCDEATTVNEIHFLMTEDVSLKGLAYKTDIDNTNMLLELFQNLQVKKVSDTFSYGADYYLLFRDKNDTAICLIEIWDRYIRINHSDFYEAASDELFTITKKVINESKELSKVPIENILITYAKENLYDEINDENIVLYNGKPAILMETGYETNHSEKQLYYETFIYYDGLYFDSDYQTTYMLSQSRIYYCKDKIQDIYTKRVAYYDYFTGKRMPFLY